jgi:methanogenic corrinoid protein MtbC1
LRSGLVGGSVVVRGFLGESSSTESFHDAGVRAVAAFPVGVGSEVIDGGCQVPAESVRGKSPPGW